MNILYLFIYRRMGRCIQTELSLIYNLLKSKGYQNILFKLNQNYNHLQRKPSLIMR